MVVPRRCKERRADGEPCLAAPLLDGDYCWVHDPDNAAAAAEARRLGGLRRRREASLSGAYDFEGLTTVAAIRRILEIAVLDTLGLDNSIGRARTLIAAAQTAARLLETGELEGRIAVLEGAVLQRQGKGEPSPFDGEDDNSGPFLMGAETS